MSTRLETFTKMTIKRGGNFHMHADSVWYKIDEKNGYSVYKTVNKFHKRKRIVYNLPVYQIYNTDGKRVFTSESFTETMRKFKYLTEFLYSEI